MKKFPSFLVATMITLIGNVSIAQNPVVQNILNNVSIDSMAHFVRQLTGKEQVVIGSLPESILSRHRDQPGNEVAFQFVKEKFSSYGLLIDSLQFSATGKNLMGMKMGTIFPDRKFILGAHYDNIGDTIAPGADDNASGSAAVIEAARVFSEFNFPFTVIFALWDEEEQGLLGSNAYASMADSNDEKILGYINMDMLGWDDNNDFTADLHFRHVSSSLELASKAINANINYNINVNLHLVDPGSGNTDHAAFWNNGFAAIGLNEEYDNDFNPFWHTPADSLGQFNMTFYEGVAKLAYATLADCALDSSSSLSINKQSIGYGEIEIFPNPVKDKLTIKFEKTYFGYLTINIYNLTGHLISSYSTDGRSLVSLNIQDFIPGIYLLQVYENQSLIGRMKLIKQE